MAVDKHGWSVEATDRRAAKFCAVGALARANGRGEVAALDLLGNVCQQTWNAGIISVNDTQGYEAIVECFDLAIAQA